MTIDAIMPGVRVLCAVSGGVDSMYLLHRMTALGAQRGFAVGCAHFNHGLRGAESDRDEAFVRAQCEKLGVPFYAGCGDVASVRGMGTEAAARELRYAFLTRCAAEHGYDWIATAHTADDNAETLLLNLARGCGLRGLTGIPPQRGKLLRPMLDTTRAQAEAYLTAHAIPHVEDSTNAADAYARNRVRHHAVPVLESVNPAFVQHAADTAALLREDEAFLCGLAADFLAGQMPAEGIPIAELLALPHPVCVRALQQAAGRELSRRHLLALERLCDGEGLGYADVPGLRVTREQGRLFFGAQALPTLGTHILRPGETAEIPELGLRVTVGVPEPFREIHSAFTTFCFKSAIIHDKLSVTPRRPGDRIRLAGRGCTKRVSDLFAERGLTQAERDRVPIIRAADAPAAIAGFGVAEQCAAAPGQTMICIRMEQIQTYGGEYYERYER